MSNDFGRIKYYINEEKGTVVAKFISSYHNCNDDDTWCILLRKTLDKIGDDTYASTHIIGKGHRTLSLGSDSIFSKIIDYTSQNDKFYGFAKCSPEDKFDAEIGKEIARKKLLAKYFKFEKKMLQIVRDMYTDFATEYFANLRKRIELCDYKIDKNTVKA